MLEPDLLTTVTTTLRHPTTIAALASVGLHATLGAILPAFPIAVQPISEPILGNVELVELTPGELQRLPPLELPPLEDLSAFGDLPGVEDEFLLPPEPELGLGAETLPNDLAGLPAGLPGDPSLYDYGINPSALLTPTPLPPAPGRAAALPPRPSVRIPSSPTRPAPPRRNNASRPNAAAPPRFSLPNAAANAPFQTREYENPGDLLNQLGNRRPEERADETQSVAAAPRPDPPPTAPASEPERPRSPQEIAAAQQQQREAENLARIEAQRRQLRATSRNTTEQEVARNEENWRAATPQAPQASRSTRLTGAYPRAACPLQASGTAIYGVMVAPNGSVSNLSLLQSAGRNIFDRQARSQVQNHRYATADGPIPYRVSVSFQYANADCPALTVPAPANSPDGETDSAE